MARLSTNLLPHLDKDEETARLRLLSSLGRSERWQLQALRLWALRRAADHTAPTGGRPEDWRVAFLASLEPVGLGRRVQVEAGALDDALADINACLGIIAAAPGKTWRFHHPGCLGLDPDESRLLDFLRLAAWGETDAAVAILRGQFPGTTGSTRAERALRYFTQAAASLARLGLSAPRGGREPMSLH